MNKKSTQERAQMLQLLVEGNSLRAVSRISGASINTVTKLLVEAGEACAWYQDKNLRNLPCKRVQVDEIWSFVYSKAKNVPEGMEGQAGDVWTWTAIDAETKLVPSWLVSGRDADAAQAFCTDLAGRMANRIQLTSDGHRAYLTAVESAFGADVDYAQLVKIYGSVGGDNPAKRYSPGECCGIKKSPVTGAPNEKHVSTSFVERQNLTMRMCMRRFTRLTNGFSKKVDNHCHAIALHFMNYNFCRIHKTLRVSPAMAAGVSQTLWTLEDVVNMMDAYYENKKSN
jgi:IS1 family transposase